MGSDLPSYALGALRNRGRRGGREDTEKMARWDGRRRPLQCDFKCTNAWRNMAPHITILLAIFLALSAVAAQPEVQMPNELSGKRSRRRSMRPRRRAAEWSTFLAGKYVSGPLWMKDGVELHLQAGATVEMSHDAADWPAGVRALVNSNGAKNIAITGRGTFDGAAQWEYLPVRGRTRRSPRNRSLPGRPAWR